MKGIKFLEHFFLSDLGSSSLFEALMLLMQVAEFLMAKAKKEQKSKWLNTSAVRLLKKFFPLCEISKKLYLKKWNENTNGKRHMLV